MGFLDWSSKIKIVLFFCPLVTQHYSVRMNFALEKARPSQWEALATSCYRCWDIPTGPDDPFLDHVSQLLLDTVYEMEGYRTG